MKSSKGITLIALIITIIVMLILAGVTISVVVNGGLFDQAKNAKTMTEEAKADEMAEIIGASVAAMKYTGTDFEDNVKKALDGTGFEFVKLDEYGNAVIKDTVTGREYTIEQDTFAALSNRKGENVAAPALIAITAAPTTTVTAGSADDPRKYTTSDANNESNGVVEIAWLDKDNNVINSPAAPILMGMDKTDGTGGLPTGDWYDYSTKKWANAKNSDESMFVWIPRFAYKIIYFDTEDHANGYRRESSVAGITGYSTIYGIVNADGNKVVEDTVPEIKDRVKTAGYTDYIPHPAFLGTGAKDVGGGFGGSTKGIEGFWTAKFEMSGETNGTPSAPGNVATSATIKAVSKPNVSSWRNINIANSYENSLAYDKSKKSHLMKNSEWGAVAFLTQSKYGQDGKRVNINNNSGYYTGWGATDGSESSVSYSSSSTANLWTGEHGLKASSTGNISGIYDLSGGAWERTAAYNTKYDGATNWQYFGGPDGKSNDSYKPAGGKTHFAHQLKKAGNISTEYVTAYTNSGTSNGSPLIDRVTRTGDAIKEVWVNGSTSWFGDYAYFTSSGSPFFVRGGHYNSGSAAGVFASYNNAGGAHSDCGFRVVLVP